MSDSFLSIKNSDVNVMKEELLKRYTAFFNDNPIKDDISKADTIEKLQDICNFLEQLKIIFERIDILSDRYDYSSYFAGLALAIKENDCRISGCDYDKELIHKYSLYD